MVGLAISSHGHSIPVLLVTVLEPLSHEQLINAFYTQMAIGGSFLFTNEHSHTADTLVSAALLSHTLAVCFCETREN